MEYIADYSAKKSLYIFLSSLLGILLFLVLHQVIVSLYLALLTLIYNSGQFSISWVPFFAADYTTLIITLLLGAWYGVWLGQYWYDLVYHNGQVFGVSHYIVSRFWPKGEDSYNLKHRVATVALHVEKEMKELEHFLKINSQKTIAKKSLAPKKRIVSRKISKA